jgi:hypothetical protein
LKLPNFLKATLGVKQEKPFAELFPKKTLKKEAEDGRASGGHWKARGDGGQGYHVRL